MTRRKGFTVLVKAAALAVAFALGCESKRDQAAVQRPSGNSTPAKGAVADRSSTSSIAPKTDCMIDEVTKLRKKCIITKKGMKTSSFPGGPQNGQDVNFYFPYFDFEKRPSPTTGNSDFAYYCIGTTPEKGSILGWVSSDFAVEWNHRIALRPTTQDKILFFATLEEAMKWRSGDRSARPIFEKEYDFNKPSFFPWPIIDFKEMPINDRQVEFVRCGLVIEGDIGSAVATATSNPVEPVESLPATTPAVRAVPTEVIFKVKSAIPLLDIVFVIDTTNSMEEEIEAAKKASAQIAKDTEENFKNNVQTLGFQLDIAFGMVEYRDYVDGLYFDKRNNIVWKLYPLVNDINTFLRSVNNVKDADVSSVDYPEAGLDGLKAALTQIKWRGQIDKDGTAGMSTRIIVLIGDDSFHIPPHPKNPNNISMDWVIRTANDPSYHASIFSLCAYCAGPQEEKVRHHKHFSDLAVQTGGACFFLANEVGKVMEAIKLAVIAAKKEAKVKYDYAVEMEEGRFSVDRPVPEIRPSAQISTEIEEDKLTQAVRVISREYFLEQLKACGVNVEDVLAHIGRYKKAFVPAWTCMEDSQGTPWMEREVMTFREELGDMITELNTLSTIMVQQPKTLEQLRDICWRLRLGKDSFFSWQSDIPSRMGDYERGKILPWGSHSELNKTRKEFITMGDSERARLIDKIENFYIPNLQRQKADTSRFPWSPNPFYIGFVVEKYCPRRRKRICGSQRFVQRRRLLDRKAPSLAAA